jgi:hypothetical protein
MEPANKVAMTDERTLKGAKIGDSLLYRKTFNTSANRAFTVGKEYPIIDVAPNAGAIQIRDDKGTSRWVSSINWHSTWNLQIK